jgi:hypothetical protein
MLPQPSQQSTAGCFLKDRLREWQRTMPVPNKPKEEEDSRYGEVPAF